MTKTERAAYVQQQLAQLYPNPAIPLWHFDHYSLLIAVLLSAQCTDARVNTITPTLFARAKTPEDMLKLSVADINAIVRPCGLAPRKAQAISSLSKDLVEKFNSQVPDNYQDLESLAGVGHKTAAVVMSQGFGVPAFPVDTHIHRLAQRWGLTQGKNVVMTETDLKKLYKAEFWNKLHLQFIYYGREFCTARACDGTICPMCKALYPKRRQPPKVNKA